MFAIKLNSKNISRKPINEYRKLNFRYRKTTETTFILLTSRAYRNSTMCQINVRLKLNVHTKKCK